GEALGGFSGTLHQCLISGQLAIKTDFGSTTAPVFAIMHLLGGTSAVETQSPSLRKHGTCLG
ncbi:MAG: hypothetical protein ABW146_07465, partial [Candidatus Sedimenticola sp. 6PFRAG7]